MATTLPINIHKPLTQEQTESMWRLLKNALDQIHNHNAATLSYEQLYRCGYQLVLNKHGEWLYEKVQSSLRDHLRKSVAEIMQVNDSQFLGQLIELWKDYQTTLRMVADVLMYMDRHICLLSGQKVALFVMGIELYRQEVLEYVPLSQRLINQILDEMKNDRLYGGGMDRRLIRQILAMLQSSDPNLGFYRSRRQDRGQDREMADILRTNNAEKLICYGEFYENIFEQRFLEETTEFYQEESYRAINQLSVSQYLDKAEARMHQEMKRAEDSIMERTRGPLLDCLIQVWVKEHAMSLVTNETEGCEAMFESELINELSKLFNLLSRSSSTLLEVQSVMESCIIRNGDRIMNDSSLGRTPTNIVQDLLDLRLKYGRYVHLAFLDYPSFQRGIKIGFETLLNRDTRAARFLSVYLDELVRQHQLINNGQEFSGQGSMLESKIDSVVQLFRYIEDKDVFESFYRDLMGRRLLSNRSISEDIERFIVAKLQIECGRAYTTKLEGMLRDVSRSKELDIEFRRITVTNQALRISPEGLSVSVLTSGHWSVDTNTAIMLPLELRNLCNEYERFYLDKHTGRRLTWLGSQGIGELRGNFETCKRDLLLGTVPMLILLVFNRKTILTYDEIVRELQIQSQDELKRHLISLTMNPKIRLLIRRNSHRSEGSSGAARSSPWLFTDDDVFEVNTSFTSRSIKVRVPAVKAKLQNTTIDAESSGGSGSSTAIISTSTQQQLLPAAVESERRLQTDAAIVRVMKSRKMLKHNDLIMEVTRLLSDRFVPKPTMVKTRIANLIDRDFLERSNGDV